MRLIFCHGLESAPTGRKFHAMKDAGLPVEAPDFRGMNLAARVDKLRGVLAGEPAVLVGSSYGGITALCAAQLEAAGGGDVGPLILLAPALARAEPPATELELTAPTATTIIHGTRDDIVPITVSREFASRDPNVELIEVDDDHYLAGSLDLIVETVRRRLPS